MPQSQAERADRLREWRHGRARLAFEAVTAPGAPAQPEQRLRTHLERAENLGLSFPEIWPHALLEVLGKVDDTRRRVGTAYESQRKSWRAELRKQRPAFAASYAPRGGYYAPGARLPEIAAARLPSVASGAAPR